MNIFTRRNALIGYLALQALKRARRNTAVGYLAVQGLERARPHRAQRAFKVSLYAALAIVSIGVLAGLAYFWRRQASATDEGFEQAVDTEAPAAEPATDALAAMEPTPAT
jgi:hypothetical protein